MAKKKRAATSGELGDLHKMVAVYFKHRLIECDPNREFSEDELEVGEDGALEKPFVMPMSTAELGVIVNFLAKNDITCEPDDETLSELRDEFTDDFELKRQKKQEAILARTEEEAEQATWI